jgi:hypothetical protein
MAEKAQKKTEVVEGLNLASVNTAEKANQGVEMEIEHPGTGEGTGGFLTICGEDSEQHAKAMNILSRKRMKAQRKTGRVEVIHDDIQDGMVTLAVNCVIGWRGILEDGVEVPFNRANLRRILTTYKFVLEQVNAFIGDRSNFLPD